MDVDVDVDICVMLSLCGLYVDPYFLFCYFLMDYLTCYIYQFPQCLLHSAISLLVTCAGYTATPMFARLDVSLIVWMKMCCGGYAMLAYVSVVRGLGMREDKGMGREKGEGRVVGYFKLAG